MSSRLLPATALCALAVAAAPALGEMAPVPGLEVGTVAGYPSSWRVTGMPDLDQIRASSSTHPSLPDEGRMYCAPTGASDILAVLSAMGQADGLVDGTRDWQLDANYDDAVTAIYEVGRSMGTDGTTGTTGDGYLNGIDMRLTRTARVAGTRVGLRHAYSTWSPDAGDLVALGANGAVATVSWGLYEKHIDAAGLWWQRLGGHTMALTSAWADPTGSVGGVTIHDPATSSTFDTVQSPFTDDPKALAERQRLRVLWDRRFHDVQVTPWGTAGTKFLEGYVAVYPKRLWVITPGGYLRLTPAPLLDGDPVIDEVPLPTGGAADAAVTPQGSLVVLGPRGQITQIGAGAGSTRMPDHRLGTVNGATQVAVASDGSIVTAGAGKVTVLQRWGGRRTLPLRDGAVTDLAFDAVRGEIQVLMDGRTVVGFRKGGRLRVRPVQGGHATRLRPVPAITAGGVLDLDGKTWRLPRGSRVAAEWEMPTTIEAFPGVIDGGQTDDEWAQPRG